MKAIMVGLCALALLSGCGSEDSSPSGTGGTGGQGSGGTAGSGGSGGQLVDHCTEPVGGSCTSPTHCLEFRGLTFEEVSQLCSTNETASEDPCDHLVASGGCQKNYETFCGEIWDNEEYIPEQAARDACMTIEGTWVGP
ncbi:MAG: hypothetical protein R3B89_07820 [Polyangiaceae bacterium]